MKDDKPYIVNGERKSHTEYIKTKYEDLRVRVPLGKKEQISLFVQSSGESLNAFVNRAIDETMQHDIQGTTTTTAQVSPATAQAPNQFILPLSQEELEQLNKHCLFSLCKKPDFIREAIKEKLQRESPPPIPLKKESLPQKGKPRMIVRQTDDDSQEEQDKESDLLPWEED